VNGLVDVRDEEPAPPAVAPRCGLGSLPIVDSARSQSIRRAPDVLPALARPLSDLPTSGEGAHRLAYDSPARVSAYYNPMCLYGFP